MDTEERELLAATVEQALARRHGDDGDDVLAAIGWADVLLAEPAVAVPIVFDALGRHDVRSSCLSDVVATTLGRSPGTAVVLPRFGSAEPPGDVDRGRATVAGTGTVRTAAAPTLLVGCGDGSAVTVRAADLEIVPVPGIDPSLGLSVVSGVAEILDDPSPADWDAAVDAGRTALAHELTGACRTMLVLACDHARARVQFGRPIASFQAVRHRLAEVLVAVEAAEAALEAAHDSPSPLTATLAKVLAGRAAASAGAHCQQVLAGIGFTRDHEFHRYLLRTIALDGLFGTATTLTHALGAALMRDRVVPRVIDL